MSAIATSSAEFDAHNQRLGSLDAGKIGKVLSFGLAAATVAGHGAMIHEKHLQSPEPVFDVHKNPASNRLVFPLFGCLTVQAAAAQEFEDKLGYRWNTAYTHVPNVGVPTEKVGQGWSNIIQDTYPDPRDASLAVYAHSFGGYMLSIMASNPWFREHVNQVDTLVLDGTFASRKAIKPKGRLLLDLATALQFSWTMSKLVTTPTPNYLEADRNMFMLRHHAEPGALEGFAKHVFVVRAEDDPELYVPKANQSIQQLFGSQKVHFLIDPTRPPLSHANAILHPGLVGELLDGNHEAAHAAAQIYEFKPRPQHAIHNPFHPWGVKKIA